MKDWICSVMEPLNREWKFIAKQELVRCKDCVYYIGGGCGNVNGDSPSRNLIDVKPDWYCADGERAENAR